MKIAKRTIIRHPTGKLAQNIIYETKDGFIGIITPMEDN